MNTNTLKAQIWDKMHYVFRDINDCTMHYYISYNLDINTKLFAKAVYDVVSKCDVLHSSYVFSKFKSHWQVNNFNENDIVKEINVSEDKLQNSINNEIIKDINLTNKVQIKITLIKHNSNTEIVILINHMCMDGNPMKMLIKDVFYVYNCLLHNKQYHLKSTNNNRELKQIYNDMSFFKKLSAKTLFRGVYKDNDFKLPFSENSKSDFKFLEKVDVSSEYFKKIKDISKKFHCSINDILLAAFYKALYDLDRSKSNLVVSCAIDLRRHLSDSKNIGYTNHISWMQCVAPNNSSDNKEFIKQVNQVTNLFKEDKFLGLHGLPIIRIISAFSDSTFIKLIKRGYSNPYIAMSNIGCINKSDIEIDGVAPLDSFISGSIKYKPYFLLSACTYANKITLSSGIKGSKEDVLLIKSMLNKVKNYIYDFVD